METPIEKLAFLQRMADVAEAQTKEFVEITVNGRGVNLRDDDPQAVEWRRRFNKRQKRHDDAIRRAERVIFIALLLALAGIALGVWWYGQATGGAQ